MENKNEPAQTPLAQNFLSEISEVSTVLGVSLSRRPADWADSLASVGFSSIHESNDSLEVSKSESYSIGGKPRHFIRLKLSKENLTITYTLDSSQNPSLRALEAASIALHTLSCLDSVKLAPDFSSFLCSSLENAIGLLTPSSAQLEHQNSKMKKTVSDLNDKISDLYSQREKDSKRASADSVKIAQLEAKISKLTSIPDGMLDELVLNWLTTHDGELSVSAFCQNHPIPPSRLEQSLERLCRASKIKGV